MADMQKKMGAALAAVSVYLQDEEAVAAAQQAAAGPQQQMNLWAQCGRQEMMNMRKLIQMRAFQRCR